MSSRKVRRLFAGFVPKHYTLTLEPDRDTMLLTGNVTVTGQKMGRPSQRLTFHQHGLKVTHATITKHDKKGDRSVTVARINHHQSFDEVRLHAGELLYPGRYTVTMQFAGRVQDSMHGVYVSNYEREGTKQKIVSTQFESHHAREAFPCIDEPEAKATFDLTLLSPKGEAAISNMPAASHVEKDGKLATTFETTPKMSTYLLAFVYGDLQHKETKTAGGTAVRVWATKVQPAASLDFALQVAKQGIEFFDTYYGVPYPLSKCDHVALPDFSSAAMENWGLITYREPFLLVDPETTSQSAREYVSLVISHELSHQWFGNLVTMRWWDDLWLNESFANMMEYVATDTFFPEWSVWNMAVTMEGLAAFRRDSIDGVQPIKCEVRHPDEISTLFDPSIVYAKGGRLLRMLLHYVGEDDFRTGLKDYFATHAYANTTGDDLWAALAAASSKDVSAFMDPWLTRPGFPIITVDQKGAQLELTQTRFTQNGKKSDDTVWPVPLLSNNKALPALLREASAKVTLPADTHVRINQGAVGHYVVRYKNPTHAAAIAGMVDTKDLSIAERLMLLSDSAMLARAGIHSLATTLELLEHYAAEDSEPVWDIMALVVADARRFVDVSPNMEPKVKAFLRKLIDTQYKRLGWEEKPKESSHDTKLRATIIGLGVYAEHTAIVAHALELFEAYKNTSASIDSELRAIVFGAAVRNGVEGAFTYLLELDESTQNVDLEQDIQGALTLTKKSEEVNILLARLKDIEKVRPHDVDRWVVCLLRSRYARTQAWDWLRGNWDWIEQTFGGDKSYDTFPRYAASAFNTRVLLEEYRAFFSPLQDQPALTRNITMGIEELENRIAWLERDLSTVKKYFKS